VPDLDPVRLYLIGRIDQSKDKHTLTTFAEWNRARGLAHIQLDKPNLDRIIAQIAELKGVAEGGVEGFGQDALAILGEQLFNIVINGQARDLFQRATAVARDRRMKRLPLEIIAEDYQIAGWPWEYLYDGAARCFISQEFHPISRSIFTLEPPHPCQEINGKIKILILLGVPPDDLHTSPEEEIKAIHEVFSTQLDKNSFEIRIFSPSDYRKLQMELQNNPYDIVHFFGHAGFDHDTCNGYLSFARPGMQRPFRFYASDFARLLEECSGTRLVFLNACKTAEATPSEGPGRSSVAGALLSKGIPAVIGAQFSLPDQNAHFLAATTYNSLLGGRPLDEAIRSGRSAMCLDEHTKFFDWGIPVLYSIDPSVKLFPGSANKYSWARIYDNAPGGQELIQALTRTAAEMPGNPSVVVEGTERSGQPHKNSVALIDIDSKVGFLPELVRAANRAQSYYEFKVAYVPVPIGYVRSDLGDRPETYLPRLESYLSKMTKQLSADFVCCLTQNPVAGKKFSNHFAATLDENRRVFVVSTCDVREFAQDVQIPFAKAVLALCLSMLLVTDGRWPIGYHSETQGCLFDYCEVRSDLKVGLAKMRFDHEPCRAKIGDPEQLNAIDALAGLAVPES
jgi:CHAT domain